MQDLGPAVESCQRVRIPTTATSAQDCPAGAAVIIEVVRRPAPGSRGRRTKDVLAMEEKHELHSGDQGQPSQNNGHLRPWRTEGLPKKQAPKRRLGWITWALWL